MDQPTTTLETVPGELLSNIAARLHVDDMSSLRLVSRALEQRSFHEFATEYFSEKCFIFTTDSLKVLVEIAKSDRLRGYLHHVHFMTAIFSNTAFYCPPGYNYSWQPSVKQKEAFRGYVQDQKMLKTTKRDQEMLSEAFTSLPNLTTLSLDDSPWMLGPAVDYHGYNKVSRLCKRRPLLAPHARRGKSFKEYDVFFRHVWEVILYAVQHSTSLTRLGTHLGTYPDGVPIAWLDSKRFSKSIPALKGLTALLLRIRSHESAGCICEKNCNDVTNRELYTLFKFARALPSLEVLDLGFDGKKATASYLAAFVAGLDMSKITMLYLGGIHTSAAILVKILHNVTSVKDLRIVLMNLIKGSWVSVLKVLQKMTERLEHLHLMYLREANRKVYLLKRTVDDDVFAENEYDDAMHYGNLSDEDITDDDLPPLEPGDTVASEIENASLESNDAVSQNTAAAEPASTVSANTAPPSTAPTITVDNTPLLSLPTLADTTPMQVPPQPSCHSNFDHVRPDRFKTGERGYFVCVQGEEIAAQLPIFIQEYNLGEDADDAMGMPHGLGGAPPAFNDFMNTFGAALGVPGVQPSQGGNVAPPGGVAGAAPFPIPPNIPPFPPPAGPAPPPPPAPSANAALNASAASTGNENGNAAHGMSADVASSSPSFPWDYAEEDEWEDSEDDDVD